ncbi:MMPL family transporter [Formicincola oecophyllae]|uniref:MMPL family transporter n=1 Tax=Formicincola oecophyllae TaxID=2558361 RepID=A0A4Y6U9U1_9PROT|nr:efflux RND transporter permease subunit [Formicincola oecophyllae]QDH13131.1 MMPL family transporter [Formicincola oecophyllae]
MSGFNPSRLFIERPVATILLMVALLLSGLLGGYFLPVAALPNVEYPTIVVSTFYPGASPDVMGTSVTAPLETQLGQMPGLDAMMSQSSGGASVITLRFAMNMAMDVAEQEVQAAINNANSLLPSDLPTPPVYAKVNPADAPVVTLGLTSKVMPLTDVSDYVNTRLQQKLSEIPGVGLVSLQGGHRKALRVKINVPKLTSYGIALDTVRTIISTVNVNSPTGTFDGPQYATTLRMEGQITSPDMLANQIIAYQNNGPVRLKDVGSVTYGPENTELAAWANGQPGLVLSIQKQPGANVIDVADNVKAMLPRLRTELPPGIDIVPLADRTVTIRASVEDVEIDLALAVFLVVAVIFLFLRNVPATIIPTLSVPLSLIGTLGVMDLLGYSMDNLSLMALTIAAGFVVDDAIVVIENIARLIGDGMEPFAAALKGSAEIGFTIISLTVSLIAVLIPLLFMSDVMGRLFHEFAMVLAITIVISALVSLTLVPMMCARILKPAHSTSMPAKAPGLRAHLKRLWWRFMNEDGAILGATLAWYKRSLEVVLRHQPLTMAVMLSSIALTGFLAWEIPKGFFPTQDTGLVQGISVLPETISFQGMAKRQEAIGRAILQDPDVASLSSFIGVDGQNMTINTGRFQISLKDRAHRTSSLPAILARLRQCAKDVPGATLHVQPVQDISLNSTVSAEPYQLVVESPDQKAFTQWAPRFVQALQAQPAIGAATSDLAPGGQSVLLKLDRQTAARYSITPQTLDNLLYDGYGQRQVSTIYTQSNQYRVILEAAPHLQRSLDDLYQLYLPGITGNAGQSSTGDARQPTSGLVPLTQVAALIRQPSALMISHYAQFPATLLSFSVAAGHSLGEAIKAVTTVQSNIHLPQNFHMSFQGTAAAFQTSLGHELALVVIALVAVYLVLGILYESYVHPITILSTLPSAGIGALLGLEAFDMPLDVMGIIGIVLLIGIVKKNAIMMIDFALQAEREEGMSPLQSITQAALLRFRPILMTTLAALFGAVPLMIGSGAGSALRKPLGVAIICGLMFSQVLTLFTTPVVYLYMERFLRAARKALGLKPTPSHQGQGAAAHPTPGKTL